MYTIINCILKEIYEYRNIIWTYPSKPLLKNSIDVLPEKSLGFNEELTSYKPNCFGVCSDYIGIIKKI